MIAAGTRATAPVVVRADPRIPFDTMAALAQLRGLGFALFFSYDEAPNAITQQAMAALHEALQGYLARYEALLRTDVPAFNRLAGQYGMGGVIAR